MRMNLERLIMNNEVVSVTFDTTSLLYINNV